MEINPLKVVPDDIAAYMKFYCTVRQPNTTNNQATQLNFAEALQVSFPEFLTLD